MKKRRYNDLPQGSGSYLEHQGLEQDSYSGDLDSSKRSMSGIDKALIALSTGLVLGLVVFVATWLIPHISSDESHRSAEVDYIEVAALKNPVHLSRSDEEEPKSHEVDKETQETNPGMRSIRDAKVPRVTENFADKMARIGNQRLNLLKEELSILPTNSAPNTPVQLQAPSPAYNPTPTESVESRRSFATVQVPTAPTTMAQPTASPTAVTPVTEAPTLPPTPSTEAWVNTPTEETIPVTTPTFEVETEPTETSYEPTESIPTTEQTTSETEYVTEESTYETTPEQTTVETTPEPTPTPAPTSVPEPTSPPVDTDEMDLFYRVIAAESGGFWDIEGRTRIAEVIVNRVNAGQGSLYSVLTAKNQFTVVENGSIHTVTVTEADRVAAHRALAGANPILPTNTLYFCTEGAYASYEWFQGLTVVEKYYNVYFMAP